MPILVSNGKRYRISLLGGLREERPSYGAKTASAVRYQVTAPSRANSTLTAVYPNGCGLQVPARASPRWVFAYPAMRRPLTPYQHSMAAFPDTSSGSIPWSTENDRVLRQLRTAKVSWKRISMVMDNRPIAELKQRWIAIRDGRRRNLERYDFELVDDDNDWYLEDDYDEDYGREERHVSFNPSLDEDVSTSALLNAETEAINLCRRMMIIMSRPGGRRRKGFILSTTSSAWTRCFSSTRSRQIGKGTVGKQSVIGSILKPAAILPRGKQGPSLRNRRTGSENIKCFHSVGLWRVKKSPDAFAFIYF
ncbi:uncharacterized protein BDW70DRAFT_125692 [Aspergillus foveolatus]|uniref:uncharacterized protein n=1 Tax=Aspergillus foveolatus TaxID=210207 RepID=UPI003CCDCE82